MKRQTVFVLALFALLLVSCGSEKPATQSTAPPAQTQSAEIVMFYPGQPEVAPGDQAQVCYGVQNATRVRLEPPVEEIRPLSNKCIWFKPSGSMDLTLIAVGEDGKEAKATIPIKVKAGAPSSTRTAPAETPRTALIQTFVATATTVSPGGATTLCYVLSEPATLKLDPFSGELGNDLRKCVLVRPRITTSYTLTASAEGQSDKASVTVKVQ